MNRIDIFQHWLNPENDNEPIDETYNTTLDYTIQKAPITPIFIHIGASKTGSTAFQTYLETNRKSLFRAGYWAPEFGIVKQKHNPHKQAGHVTFASLWKSEQPHTILNALAEGMHAGKGHLKAIILSSETFFLHPESGFLAKLLAPHPITVIGHLRRHDTWAEAQYAEFVAGGSTARTSLSFQDWAKTGRMKLRLSFDETLKVWENNGATVAMHVYDKITNPTLDVITDLTQRIGIHDLDLERPKNTNSFVMHAGHVELIRPLNALPWHSTNNYLNTMARIHAKMQEARKNKPKTPLVFMTPFQRNKFQEKHKKDIEALAKRGIEFADTPQPDFPGFPEVTRKEAMIILEESLKGLKPRIQQGNPSAP